MTATISLRRRVAAVLAATAGVAALAGAPAQSDAYTLVSPSVQRPMADLITSEAGAPGANQVRITNKGGASAAGFYVRVAWGYGAEQKALLWVPGLRAGASVILTSTHIGVYGGNCGVVVTADAGKQVSESNELNNDGEGYCLR